VGLSLHVGAETIKPVSAVRDLGVVLDNELTMKPHVMIQGDQRRLLSHLITEKGASYSRGRLDYCNTVLANLPVSTVASIQHVQNAAARLIKGLQPREHMTLAL